MDLKLAIVQPVTHAPPEDETNVREAVQFIREAARQGAQIILFPESYPGPWRMPTTFDPTEAMVAAASTYGVYVVYGTLEPISEADRTAYQLAVMAGPSGGDPSVYRRTHPPGPWLYEGGAEWEFNYVAANEFPVFETEHGIVGLGVCSEVYMPEVSRALALRGAELILLPAGTEKPELWSTWRTLIWARAIENLAIVATTQNLLARDERGLAMVASPERILFETVSPGMFMVEVGMENIRDLRQLEDGAGSRNAAKAGVLTQWQRPELYDKILPRTR